MFPFIEGILLGLTMSLIFGPALFTLLQTSIYRGTKAGVMIAIGIVICDTFIVMLSYFGVAQFIEDPRNQMFFSIISGIILLVFGVFTLTRRALPLDKTREIHVKVPGALTHLTKGFFLNIANPLLWFFWLSLMVGISSNYAGKTSAIISFFSGALLTIFGTDTAKVLIAQRLRQFITHHVISWINRIVGSVLVIFGIVLIVRVFYTVKIPGLN